VIWGIYIAKKYKKIIQYSLVVLNSIPLFDTIVKNIPDLSILYKGLEINPDLILIECALINTGSSSVLPDMIEEPVSLILPEEHQWVAVEKISNSNGMQAETILLNNHKLEIMSGLFRVGDFIRFKALLLVPRSIFEIVAMGHLGRIISIMQRIADMRDIPIVNLMTYNIEEILKLDYKKLKSRLVKNVLFVIVVSTIFIYFFNIRAPLPLFSDSRLDNAFLFIFMMFIATQIPFLTSLIRQYYSYKKVIKYKSIF